MAAAMATASEASSSAAAAAELLSSVFREPSSAAEEGLSEDSLPRKCRPHDLDDFRRRISSFRPHWWFNKPVGFSALAAARRGWTNVGPDLLRCETCFGELRLERDGNGAWLANGEPVAAELARISNAASCSPAACRASLENGHSAFCPWRSSEVTLHDPLRLSDEELAAGVESRCAGLMKLKHLPAVADGEKEAQDPALTLACAGWEAGGTSDGQELLRCSMCLRTLAIQAFAHRPSAELSSVRGRTEEGEPLEKAARTLSAPAPPVTGLWTPKLRVPPSAVAAQVSEAAEKALLDPYALHRYYCPLYCRPEEELGAVATRVLKAREVAASAAMMKVNSEEVSAHEATGPYSATAVADAAAARAEELLRALDAILPAEEKETS
eukprot:TRINITY_DN113186_c0_g1_i1.p1 TRINITY_DN113186_c0_g1~~TRINITY_DN113186_c0_g1_i1.p1  ORF type:complete len:384 (-),score=80.32 TRINITY_DN113186_c0_g1_i1:48-1199(-)